MHARSIGAIRRCPIHPAQCNSRGYRRGDGGFRAVVRFPPGWRRDIAGHCTVSEEILILEGPLSIDAVTARR